MKTYKDSGVDLEKGEEFVKAIKPAAIATLRNEVIAHVGGFAGCFALPTGYEDPVLVSCTDGVGTKVKLATTPEYQVVVGKDLVAMCANDLICTGADPLYFLDYYASTDLDVEQAKWVMEGVRWACNECNMALLGGETAMMPGMYNPGEFDVAGFATGIVSRKDMIDGHENVKGGNVIIGIESRGPHSNGYSLVRSILDDAAHKLSAEEFAEKVEAVMKPTFLYVKAVAAIKKVAPINAIANITGGGLFENIPRVVDTWWRCVIDPASWDTPEIFWWLMNEGNVPADEMYKVFNMGIGLVLIVDEEHEDVVIQTILEENLKAWKIGEVLEKGPGAPSVLLA